MTATNEALQISTAANIYKQNCIPNYQANRVLQTRKSRHIFTMCPPHIYVLYLLRYQENKIIQIDLFYDLLNISACLFRTKLILYNKGTRYIRSLALLILIDYLAKYQYLVNPLIEPRFNTVPIISQILILAALQHTGYQN